MFAVDRPETDIHYEAKCTVSGTARMARGGTGRAGDAAWPACSIGEGPQTRSN